MAYEPLTVTATTRLLSCRTPSPPDVVDSQAGEAEARADENATSSGAASGTEESKRSDDDDAEDEGSTDGASSDKARLDSRSSRR